MPLTTKLISKIKIPSSLKWLHRSNYNGSNKTYHHKKPALHTKPLSISLVEKDRLNRDYQVRWDDLIKRKDVQDVLSRTHTIDNEKESADIVDTIFKAKKPIAVDMEGHHFDMVQLIQIKVTDGRIYLFRTGLNNKLLIEGKLKNLLESSNILKIFHGGINDCMEIFKSGVKIANMYDTALAHNIIRYQTLGHSIHEMKGSQIGFNKICEIYKMPENPMKSIMKKSNMLWQREKIYLQPTLSKEMMAYSAFDVEPLHDLYEITKNMIEEDFKPLLNDLNESVIIRTIDPQLAKHKKLQLMETEKRNVFISGFTPKCDSKNPNTGVGKADIYETLLPYDGIKQVYFSSSSAHVIMPSRKSAVLLYNSLTNDKNAPGSIKEQFKETYGANTEVKLLIDTDSTEVAAANMKNYNQLEANIENINKLRQIKTANYITDNSVIMKLMDMITKVQPPVILEFTSKEDLGVDIFVGMHPIMKFLLTPETIQLGIGKIMASDKIIKVVPRIDTDIVSTALCMIHTQGFKSTNIFDLTSASNVLDYGIVGKSIFSSNVPSLKSMLDRLGINAPTKMENYMYAYVHLVNHLLPETLQKFVSEKTSADIDIYSKISLSEGREAKRKIRLKNEGLCVHITFEGIIKVPSKKNYDSLVMVKSLLNIILSKHELIYDRIDVFDGDQIVKGGNIIGIVQFRYPDDRSSFVRLANEDKFVHKHLIDFARSKFENLENNKLYKFLNTVGKEIVIKVKLINSDVQEKLDNKVIREADLRSIMPFIIQNVQDLEEFKFTEIMNQYT